MNKLLFITIFLCAIWFFAKFFRTKKKDNGYNKDTGHYNKGLNVIEKKSSLRKEANTFSNPYKFIQFFTLDQEAIKWCANFLGIDEKSLTSILRNIHTQYNHFYLKKRRGGHRAISAPKSELLSIQKAIYHQILLPVDIHPAATGFRPGISIADNARPHLGHNQVLKTDIRHFFGSIKRRKVIKAFIALGYQNNISKVLAELCCLVRSLPQGAPTSPALSNIIAYEMDKRLQDLSNEYHLTYTRYADDLTFSGDSIDPQILLPLIDQILSLDRFKLKDIKTRFIRKNRRKIITGVSISSGDKLTIPRAKKRELRKNIHFILTKGLVEHQRYIGSTDPLYLKRIIGYLSYWRSIEPDNNYVLESMTALRKLEEKTLFLKNI